MRITCTELLLCFAFPSASGRSHVVAARMFEEDTWLDDCVNIAVYVSSTQEYEEGGGYKRGVEEALLEKRDALTPSLQKHGSVSYIAHVASIYLPSKLLA